MVRLHNFTSVNLFFDVTDLQKQKNAKDSISPEHDKLMSSHMDVVGLLLLLVMVMVVVVVFFLFGGGVGQEDRNTGRVLLRCFFA